MEKGNLKELYEVFRVESGVPLFIEDHVERVFHGAREAGIILNTDYEEIMEYLSGFLGASRKLFTNARLSFYFDAGSKKSKYYKARFIPSHYPEINLYQEGVSCKLMHSERLNPEAKIANHDLRNRADELITQQNIFEVLLVNRAGEITEGSRVNVFFIRDNVLFSAPDKTVLPGIIRKKTLELVKQLKIPLELRCINACTELKTMDAAFITGTSPRILPINKINNIDLHPEHPIIRELMLCFEKLVNQYIADHSRD